MDEIFWAFSIITEPFVTVLRSEFLERLLDEYQVEGVVEMTLQACHTYNVEAGKVGRFVREEKKIPYLHVETDYSQSDVGQLNTRIAALIEML